MAHFSSMSPKRESILVNTERDSLGTPTTEIGLKLALAHFQKLVNPNFQLSSAKLVKWSVQMALPT
jgi:hypothetical protein